MTTESMSVTGLPRTDPVPDGREVLEYASWLTTDTLLLVGRFARSDAAPVEAIYLAGADAARLDLRCLSYRSPDDDWEGGCARALLLRFPGSVGGPRFAGGLELTIGGASHFLDAAELSRVTIDLQSLLREVFAPLPPQARADVGTFLASAL